MKRKFAFNIVSSLMYQIIAVVCGFILPRLILNTFGSETNGLVNSISQFLTIISFADMGVSAVIQSALYEPIYKNDNEKVNMVVASGRNFYKKIGGFMCIYIVLLSVIYPLTVNSSFGISYIIPLIFCMGINQYLQGCIGITEAMFLGAMQKNYVNNWLSGFVLIVNTILCSLTIKMGFGIQTVKLITSIVFIIRPVFLKIYVKKNYNIQKCTYENDPITQKWNGMAQHIGGIVIEGTDSIILTIFSSLLDVSVYSIYYLVTHGINTLITSVINNSFLAVVGELWVKGQDKDFNDKFSFIEWSLHMLVTFLYTCTNILIVGFVILYTKGVHDTNYIRPVFAFMLVTANLLWSLRMPYHILIKAANKYKETQRCYVIAAVINIVVSVICVGRFGLIGVTIGTIISMSYQTTWMYIYVANSLIPEKDILSFIKMLITDFCVYIGCFVVFNIYKLRYDNMLSWIVSASIVVGVVTFILFISNWLFYRNYINRLFFAVVRKLKREKINNGL